jgi:hypothetical protein
LRYAALFPDIWGLFSTLIPNPKKEVIIEVLPDYHEGGRMSPLGLSDQQNLSIDVD